MKKATISILSIILGFILGSGIGGYLIFTKTRDPKMNTALSVYRLNVTNLSHNQSHMDKQLIEYIKGQNYYMAIQMGTYWVMEYGAKDYGKIDEETLNGIKSWKGGITAEELYQHYKKVIK